MSSGVPFIAGAALALAELAFSFLQPVGERGLRRLAWAAAAGFAGVLVSALVLLAATPNVGRSLVLTIVGTAAALIVIGLLSRLWMRA